MFYFILKIHGSLFLLATVAGFVVAIYCPPFCKCSVTNRLRHVKCSGQNLINVELDIPTTVQWLELSYNFISELRDNIFQDLGFEKITLLNLNNNAINYVGLKAFNGLQYIKLIDLSGNHLYRIDPATFEYNPTLEHLILSRNPLRYIPAHRPFLISTSLQNLEISQCRLSYFPAESFSSLPSLQYLNISNNDILMLQKDLFHSLKHLQELDISNTEIKCDSSSTNLLEWAVENSARIVGSPCSSSSITNKFSQLENVKTKKFEKMIMKVESSTIDDYHEDNYNEDYRIAECKCPELVEDFKENCAESTSQQPIVEVENTERSEKRKISQHDYRSMLWLAFLNGLVTGAALSTSAILFWIYCCKYRCQSNRRQRRQRPASYDSVPCETPPPSYHDLFMEFSS